MDKMATANPFEVINSFQNTAPVNVEGVSRALGVPVNYANLGNEIAGMIERRKDGSYLISVNANDALTRQRFTIAHELGHFIYHKDKMGDGIDDDKAYRSTNVGKYHNTKIGQKEETQANRFAANLLMPWDLISHLQEQGVTDYKDIADRLGVSRHAMCIRLGIPYEA
jgi:Zn-dependent peptidase ImmA (M78 family)